MQLRLMGNFLKHKLTPRLHTWPFPEHLSDNE